LLSELIVVTLSQIDGSHSAAPDLFYQAIWPETGTGAKGLIEQGQSFSFDGSVDAGGAPAIGVKKRIHLRPQKHVPLAGALQEGRSIEWAKVGGLQEDLLNPVPIVVRHGASLRLSLTVLGAEGLESNILE
jgi:hypothetical protein